MKLPFIDHMRGMAILLVLMVHSGKIIDVAFVADPHETAQPIYTLFRFGAYGVEVFFFISGFLMSHLYDSRPKQGFALDYWKKRVSRIVPLWVVFAILPFSLYLFGVTSNQFSLATYSNLADDFAQHQNWLNNPIVAFVITLLFLGWLSHPIWNNTVQGGWSIQSEMAHYGVYALLRNSRITLWLLLLIALGLVQRVGTGLDAKNGNDALDMFNRLHLFGTLSFFLIGILSRRVWAAKSAKPLGNVVDWALGLVWLALLMINKMPITNFATFKPSALWAIIVLAISTGIVWLVGKLPMLSDGLSKVGKYSYFLYFVHFWILELTTPLLNPFASFIKSGMNSTLFAFVMIIVELVLCLGIGIPLAMLSYKFIESPFLRMAHSSKK